jgi:hypothetical protein
MMSEFGFESAFKDSFGELVEEAVFAEHVFGLFIVVQKLVNEVCVDGPRFPFEFLSLHWSMSVYTKSFTPS